MSALSLAIELAGGAVVDDDPAEGATVEIPCAAQVNDAPVTPATVAATARAVPAERGVRFGALCSIVM